MWIELLAVFDIVLILYFVIWVDKKRGKQQLEEMEDGK